MKQKPFIILIVLQFFLCVATYSQQDEAKVEKQYKNIIRYDVSGALIMGIDRYLVFGYERVLKNNQSFSINAGAVALSKTRRENPADAFILRDDLKNTGFNFSADYRFYLGKENKFAPPRGVYIGPYFSFNKFDRESAWSYNDGTQNQRVVTTL